MVRPSVCDNIDTIALELSDIAKHKGDTLPIVKTLVNPIACFPIAKKDINLTARAIAEGIYLVSGMNGGDFIGEYRWYNDTQRDSYCNKECVGSNLRFWNIETNRKLDYSNSTILRQGKRGFKDQMALAIDMLISGTQSLYIPLSTIDHPTNVYGIRLYIHKDMLDMSVLCGIIERGDTLVYDILTPFAFLHQIMATLSHKGLGNTHYVISELKTSDCSAYKKSRSEDIAVSYFGYPDGELTLDDIDNLIAIMVEWTARLDSGTITRANPFEGDNRVQQFNDIAEVLRIWKARKLSMNEVTPRVVYHPDLKQLLGVSE